VDFTQSGFPDGVSAPNPKSCKPTCYNYNYITVQSFAPLGTSIITITGTAEGGLKKTKTYKLKIQDTPPPTSPDPTTPSSSSTKYSCNETNWTCEEDPNGTTWDICEANCIEGPPPPPPPAPKCKIFDFNINEKTNKDSDPLRVWVDASLKGYFSVNYVCTSCTVTSVPSDGNENWTGAKGTYASLPSSGNVTEPFKINTAGTYSYTLECIGTDPEDIVTNTLFLQTVEALNLPWWQEIIPVLRGFLGGIWR